MDRMRLNIPARYLGFDRLFEHFLVAAVASIVLIRLYLHLTGYPQVAAGNFHIAHMLWGGLALMIALLGSLLFLNNDLKNTWAILGGIGFGTFIDELGKFITKDNDYFFQPTFALIYILFILLYLIYRSIWDHQQFSSQEYLLNSVEELKEVITNELDEDEVSKALYFLSQSDQKSPVTVFLKKSFEEITEARRKKLSPYQKWRKRLGKWYSQIIQKKFVIQIIIGLFLLRAAGYIFTGSNLIFDFFARPLSETVENLLQLVGVLSTIHVVALFTQTGLTLYGSYMIWRSRLRSYQAFRNALLISIFLLQIFNFYSEPVWALFATLRDIILLTVLEYMIHQEQTKLVQQSVQDTTN